MNVACRMTVAPEHAEHRRRERPAGEQARIDRRPVGAELEPDEDDEQRDDRDRRHETDRSRRRRRRCRCRGSRRGAR